VKAFVHASDRLEDRCVKALDLMPSLMIASAEPEANNPCHTFR
jgi:hypothetical protein